MKPANCTSIYAEPEMPDWQKEQLKVAPNPSPFEPSP